MTTLWVLDYEGYDAMGGNASVFTSKELAKAAAPHVTKWIPDDVETHGAGSEREDVGHSTQDYYTVYPVVLDSDG